MNQEEYKKITGYSTPEERQAAEDAYEAGQGLVIEHIKRWDGSTNSELKQVLYNKFQELNQKQVDTPQDQAIAEIQGTDVVYKDELHEIDINVETSSEQRKILEEIRRIMTEGINADREDKSPMEEYADAVAEKRIIQELEDKLKNISYGYTAGPAQTSIRLSNGDGTYTEPIPVPRELYDHDAVRPNNSNSKNNYTSLEEILQDIQDARRLYSHDSADEELDRIIEKLKQSISMQMYIQVNGTI